MPCSRSPGGGGIPACLVAGLQEGVVSQHALQQVSRKGWYPSMPCSRSPGGGGIPACLAAGLQERVVSQHTLQVSRPTPRGMLRGLARRGSPGPHLGVALSPHRGGVQAHTRKGCIPACTEADPPMATAVGGKHPS